MELFTFIDPHTGKAITQKYPQTREEAIRHNLNLYWPGTFCDIHKTERSVYFVRSGKPACCVHDDAALAYNEALSCNEPITKQQAIVMGYNYYWDMMAFPKCGHVGMTTLSGKCFACSIEPTTKAESPRQKALDAGEAWYLPTVDKICAKGHVGARRRVANGVCEQCEIARRGPVKEVPFYRQFPDLVLSFQDAKAMGLTVYRTGEPCKNKHTGWRYVSTRTCLTCMGRE